MMKKKVSTPCWARALATSCAPVIRMASDKIWVLQKGAAQPHGRAFGRCRVEPQTARRSSTV
jgi:hypothetical protein